MNNFRKIFWKRKMNKTYYKSQKLINLKVRFRFWLEEINKENQNKLRDKMFNLEMNYSLLQIKICNYSLKFKTYQSIKKNNTKQIIINNLN